MPPKRKDSVEDNTIPKKKLKFAKVLSPTSYAVKQSSPRKTRGGAKLGGVMGPNMTMVNNPHAAFNTFTNARKQLGGDPIAIKSTVSENVTSATAVPSPPPPPQPTEAEGSVANAIAQTLAPTVKTRRSRDVKLTGGNDENSPFITFRAVPRPPRKSAAANTSTTTSTRVTRKAPAMAPTPAPPEPLSDSIFDTSVSEDSLSKEKDSPFLSRLKKAAPSPVLTSMTGRAVNSATTTTTGEAEKDVFVDGNPTTPSRRGRGRGRGRGSRTEPSTRETLAAVPPPPAFVLPTTPAAGAPVAEDATDDDELNAALVQPPPRTKRGRKPAAATVVSRAREPLPEVIATDPAPPDGAAATRGRGGRRRGPTRGRGGTSLRGRKAADPPRGEAVEQFTPNSTRAPVAQMSNTAYEIPAHPLTITEAMSIAIAEKPKAAYSGPVTEIGVKLLKKHVLGKLSGRGKKRLVGLEEEYDHVHHLLEQTVVSGEGNSMLVIGPRGVGKSTLVDTAIHSLQESNKGEFLVVRLNGFLQTDDKLAIREIWRQLGVEMDLEDQGGQPKTSNFADTLTSILALLSHPDELSGGAEDDDGSGRGKKTSLSVVFVLDEFDLFVTHPRQTLLYNLFDIAQARKAPIAVLGLTCRVDIVEGLEKRVKSRFSHRSVHLRLPNSIEQFWAVVRSGLEVDEDELGEIVGVGDEERGYWRGWNQKLEGLWEESKGFRRLVRRGYALTKDVKGFWASWCLFPISHLVTVEHPYLTEGMVVCGTTKIATISANPDKDVAVVSQNIASASLAGPENRLHILPALTELELSLLIAAARLDIISDTDTCNFNMAYDEYKSLAAKVKVQNSIGSTIAGGGVPGGGQGGKLWSREVAVGAWEGLGRWEILVPATVGGGAQGGVGREGRMWRVDVGLVEIGRWAGQSGGVLGGVLGKWCREI